MERRSGEPQLAWAKGSLLFFTNLGENLDFWSSTMSTGSRREGIPSSSSASRKMSSQFLGRDFKLIAAPGEGSQINTFLNIFQLLQTSTLGSKLNTYNQSE